jgi:endonuclease YncB( thermonuclease family)
MIFFRTKRLEKKLEDCDPNQIPYFSFEHVKTQCKIVYFYDGDSCTIIFKHDNKFVKLKCRLRGIDTPELRSSFGPEQFAARRVKDYVSQYNDKILTVQMYGFDKYGRTLVELFDPKTGSSINNDLVRFGMAYRYDGKTKKNFLEWYKIN